VREQIHDGSARAGRIPRVLVLHSGTFGWYLRLAGARMTIAGVELERLVAFVGIAIAVVVIPGPDMALVARNVVRYGTSAGYATVLGICLGILGWALAAGVGVVAVLAASATAFTVLKLAGAAYLIYLGIATLRSPDATLEGPGGDHLAGATDRKPLPWRRAWAQGLLSALLNPKLGVFFLTILPQFVTPGESATVQALGLAILFDVIGIAWLLTYTALLGAARSALDRPGPQKWMRRVTGTLLIGLGARVAVDRS
jgi:threonine/homoserine/homoserine lactone efflux protein